ncbi:unnamed protein product, partial [Prorocentrum cordatum]
AAAPRPPQAAETVSPAQRPRLLLPVPARNLLTDTWRADRGGSPAAGLPDLLPPAAAVPRPGLAAQRPPARSRAGGQLPARLQALDDQTVVPREVYNRMMQLGDTARGQLGRGMVNIVWYLLGQMAPTECCGILTLPARPSPDADLFPCQLVPVLCMLFFILCEVGSLARRADVVRGVAFSAMCLVLCPLALTFHQFSVNLAE